LPHIDQCHGVHVRSGFQAQLEINSLLFKGRNITYFDTIEAACNHFRSRDESYSEMKTDQSPLIFIHTGTYNPELIYVNSCLAFIGAGMFAFF